MSQFFRSRVNNDLWALLLLVLIEVLTNALSGEITVARLNPSEALLPRATFYNFWLAFVTVVLLIAVLLWLSNRRLRARLAIFLINALFTAQLFMVTILLVVRLLQNTKVSVTALILDAIIVFITNILIFTLWYWYIETGNTRYLRPTSGPAWDLLFPQRQSDYPGYEDWKPRFVDYVFVAYTTSVAFSPTDTLPLSRASKVLMMTQSAISLIAIVVVAGTAINILAGSA